MHCTTCILIVFPQTATTYWFLQLWLIFWCKKHFVLAKHAPPLSVTSSNAYSECLSPLPTPTSISLSSVCSQYLFSLSLSLPISLTLLSLFSPLCRSPLCIATAKALLHRSFHRNTLLLPVAACHVGKFLFVLISLSSLSSFVVLSHSLGLAFQASLVPLVVGLQCCSGHPHHTPP